MSDVIIPLDGEPVMSPEEMIESWLEKAKSENEAPREI